jgi:hypothetical protein
MKNCTDLVEFHHLLSVHLLLLVEWRKLDLIRRKSLVCEGSLECRKIMSANGHQASLPGKVLVQLVLQGDEALVLGLVELDASQDGT